MQIKRQAGDLSATAAARDEAAACARVVGEERAQMKREWSEMYAAHEGLQQRISSLQRQVAEECSVAQVRPPCMRFPCMCASCMGARVHQRLRQCSDMACMTHR